MQKYYLLHIWKCLRSQYKYWCCSQYFPSNNLCSYFTNFLKYMTLILIDHSFRIFLVHKAATLLSCSHFSKGLTLDNIKQMYEKRTKWKRKRRVSFSASVKMTTKIKWPHSRKERQHLNLCNISQQCSWPHPYHPPHIHTPLNFAFILARKE